MMTGAKAPQSVEDTPAADAGLPAVPREICQDNSILSLHFDQRLLLLREQAMLGVRNAEVLILISNALLLLVSLYLTYLSASNLMSSYEAAWRHNIGTELVALMFLALLLTLCLSAYFALAAALIKRLFPYHYQQSWREMHFGEQGLLFAAEELHLILQTKVTNATLLKLVTKAKYKGFGPMLQYSACHISQLRKLARNPEARLSASALARSQQVFASQSTFQQSATLYWIIGGVSLLPPFLNLLFAFTLYFTILGPRYIISRAVLVAFLDFLLDQPMVRLETLAPPDPMPKTWWQRLTAPWNN